MKLKLGISSCLLGEKVRYDGLDKRHQLIDEFFASLVEWVPVCPEVGCGLTVPREKMGLVENDKEVRLITRETRIDSTEKMMTWVSACMEKLKKENIAGFIFKNKSPSCSIQAIPTHTPDGAPYKTSPGLFAREFMTHFPHIPITDEQALCDEAACKKFLSKMTLSQE